VCEESRRNGSQRKTEFVSLVCEKKEAKLSAREVDDVKEGKGDAHLRRSSLFTVCQRQRGFSEEEETIKIREIGLTLCI